jgi:hypothetical protein
MIRNSLSANATHATVSVEPSGVEFHRRRSTPGVDDLREDLRHRGPVLGRLIRTGRHARRLPVEQRTAWTSMGSVTIAMGSTVYDRTFRHGPQQRHAQHERLRQRHDPSTTPFPSPQPWTKVADMPGPKYEAQGATVGGKVYVMGGFSSSTGTITAVTRGRHLSTRRPTRSTLGPTCPNRSTHSRTRPSTVG